jgi:2-polyprenyl-3-methyl-5-hydroxy-6-metoxy-1,4-benzoquinol methylase
MGASAAIDGPFGSADPVLVLPAGDIAAAYRRKCGADVRPWFDGIGEITLFECRTTGYRFWRPASLAGDERFYAHLSAHWPEYYRDDRWEYGPVRKRLRRTDRVLEVGCGRGFFLRSIEGRVADALGLEFNPDAITTSVTRFPVIREPVEQLAARMPSSFDAVCSFQVLEHVVDPRSFIAACLACLRPGGLLTLATPNHESAMLANREDAFDLPPHHMGHFSPGVYRRVAAMFGLEVVAMPVERRYFVFGDSITEASRSRLVMRGARRLSSMLMSAAYRWTREPGNNVLSIMKWPGSSSSA